MTKITKISIITGLALIALGVGFFINTGMDWKSWTSLIPALVFGLPILVCGLLAQNEKRRMMVAHIAVLELFLLDLGLVLRQNYGDEDDGTSLRDLYVKETEFTLKAQTTFRF